MVAHELRVRVHPENRRAFANQEHWVTGGYDDGLPEQVASFAPRIDAWEALARDHYAISDFIDLAQGWNSEDARRDFVDEASKLEADLKVALGREWAVDVSPEPGVSIVRLMGEYGCDWPMWNWEGATEAGDWPMLSEQVSRRLLDWAPSAEPDNVRGPDPDVTERLARDVRRELGPRFLVVVRA